MQRTIIEVAADTHILITLERNVKMGGSSHQRRVERKRALNDQKPIEWYRMCRIILRDGVPAEIPIKFAASRASITLLPMGTDEIANQAAQNEAQADDSTCYAHDVVSSFEAHVARQEAERFTAPPKKRKLVWVEEE